MCFLKYRPQRGHEIREKGKLSLRFVGPYRIQSKNSNVAYELDFPATLVSIHPVFHMSMLRQCLPDISKSIPVDEVEVNIPIKFLDSQVQRLRNKDVVSIKVLWRNHDFEEATLEAEEDMKKRYPHMFKGSGI